MLPATRKLTESENSVLTLLRLFEDTVSSKKLTASIYLSANSLKILKENNVAKPLKVTFDEAQNLNHITFSALELKKYLDYACHRVGFTVSLDGSVKTFDGLTLSEEEDN